MYGYISIFGATLLINWSPTKILRWLFSSHPAIPHSEQKKLHP